jgi:hypothetical protein
MRPVPAIQCVLRVLGRAAAAAEAAAISTAAAVKPWCVALQALGGQQLAVVRSKGCLCQRWWSAAACVGACNAAAAEIAGHLVTLDVGPTYHLGTTDMMVWVQQIPSGYNRWSHPSGDDPSGAELVTALYHVLLVLHCYMLQ